MDLVELEIHKQQLKEYLDDKLKESTQYEKNFGVFFKYLKPLLYTTIDVYGEYISFKNIDLALNTKASYRYNKFDNGYIGITETNEKNFSNGKLNSYPKIIKIFASKENELDISLNYFNYLNMHNRLIVPDLQGKKTYSKIDSVNVLTFMHEMFHVISPNDYWLADGNKMKKISSTLETYAGLKIDLFHGGFPVLSYSLQDKEKIDKESRRALTTNFIHEGMTELLAYNMGYSKIFAKYLAEAGLPQLIQTIPSYLPYFWFVRAYEDVNNSFLKKAYFNGTDYSIMHTKKINELAEEIRNLVYNVLTIQSIISILSEEKEELERNAFKKELDSSLKELAHSILTTANFLETQHKKAMKRPEWTQYLEEDYQYSFRNYLDFDHNWFLYFDLSDEIKNSNLKEYLEDVIKNIQKSRNISRLFSIPKNNMEK